ncbi:hypothetical protein NKG05_12525 [Oerskovia sp. M15]
MKNFGGARCSPTGEQTLADAMRISCNTAFADLGVTLGATRCGPSPRPSGSTPSSASP